MIEVSPLNRCEQCIVSDYRPNAVGVARQESMKHVKLNISIPDVNSGGHCEPSLFDQLDGIPIECQSECPSRSNGMKMDQLSVDADSESEWGTTDFTYRDSHLSMSSSGSLSSGLCAAIGQTVNIDISNADDSSASNYGIQFEDVSFADMIEADQCDGYAGGYDLFSSFMNDLRSTTSEGEKHGKVRVDSNSTRASIDSSDGPWDGSTCANNSMIEFTSDEESVNQVAAKHERANVPDCKKPLNEPGQHPVTYTLRPRTAASKTSSAASSQQSCPLSNHKKYGNVQTSSGDINISKNAQQARINRQRKKAYIQGLESKMAEMHKENSKLKSETLHLRRDKRSLEDEVLYLRRVLANDSALANLLRNIDSDGVVLSKSFENQRKRSLALDHDYGKPAPKYQRHKYVNGSQVKQASGGVCLHVDTGRVSLEFCSKCAHLANTDDED